MGSEGFLYIGCHSEHDEESFLGQCKTLHFVQGDTISKESLDTRHCLSLWLRVKIDYWLLSGRRYVMVESIERVIGKTTVRLVSADLTERDVDAIVNAANSHLQHGGGVAGAIVRRGGQVIQEESDKIGYVPVGNAAITTGGKLKARYVIHAVGPKMGEGDEDNKLKRVIRSVLTLAAAKKLKSISVPAISAGIYGFPKDRCAKILVAETAAFSKTLPDTTLELVEFCIFDQEAFGFFQAEIQRL